MDKIENGAADLGEVECLSDKELGTVAGGVIAIILQFRGTVSGLYP